VNAVRKIVGCRFRHKIANKDGMIAVRDRDITSLLADQKVSARVVGKDRKIG
jgi:hypothetical protein